MPDLVLVTHSIDVPKNTGHEGFIHTIRQILKLSRIQSINISARGKVTYERYVAGEEPRSAIGVDFTGIEPSHIIRNAINGVEEIILDAQNAAVILVDMLDRSRTDGFFPTAFVSGANSTFWDWYPGTTLYPLSARDSICGLPLYYDRHVPDTALILCASFTSDGALIDTQKAYKIEMAPVLVPRTDVEVFSV